MSRLISPILAGTLAVAGGVFFGLFSCGGYVWHKQLFRLLIAAALLGALVMPPRALGTRFSRAAFTVAVLATFVLVRAAASAFHLGPPPSWSAFGELFVWGVLYGPC